jgi:branched-chain amino acid transport system substrate-binding protein
MLFTEPALVSANPKEDSMLKQLLVGSACLTFAALPARAQQEVKIGFVTTLSGPQAVVGNDLRDAFELALDHLGRKMAGRTS